MNEIKCIELFGGAGGLACGFELAGINNMCIVEIDHTACETLRANFPHSRIIEDDIHNVNFCEYAGSIDLVSGGAPCQAFSYAGKKLGFNDARGTLFSEFARCVGQTKPKMFLFENVKGLLSHNSGHTFSTILNTFENLGYNTQYRILNACYYGVAQKRERLVIVGIRNDMVTKLSFLYPVPETKCKTLREALENCPQSDGQRYSNSKQQVMALVPPGGCWVNLPTDIAKQYMGKSYYSKGGRRGIARRISWDEPCLTLTTSPSQKQTERCHPEETRPFTIREYARIQSFPDSWIFKGTISEQYKQIGNAVPVEIARRIGIEIVRTLSVID